MEFTNRFATDHDAEVNGAWDLIPGTDCELLIARFENQKYLDLKERLQRPHLQAMIDGTMDADLSLVLHREVFAKTILLGWRNLDVDGKPVEYSVEEAIKRLEENDFFDYVISRSKVRDRYSKEYFERSEKNS